MYFTKEASMTAEDSIPHRVLTQIPVYGKRVKEIGLYTFCEMCIHSTLFSISLSLAKRAVYISQKNAVYLVKDEVHSLLFSIYFTQEPYAEKQNPTER